MYSHCLISRRLFKFQYKENDLKETFIHPCPNGIKGSLLPDVCFIEQKIILVIL